MDGSTPADRRRGCSLQAIAKAETVSGNAAGLGRSVHLCLCKTPGQDRLVALLLLVPSARPTRALGDVRLNGESRSALLVARDVCRSVRMHGGEADDSRRDDYETIRALVPGRAVVELVVGTEDRLIRREELVALALDVRGVLQLPLGHCHA